MVPRLQLLSLQSYRDRLVAEVEGDEISVEPSRHLTDVHLASSCLQKALRRGDDRFALAAAVTLLRHDPERLWRRLSVCAFEDFGLANLELTARVVAAIASKPFRLRVGERRILSHLIRHLCATAKDRRLDDLYALGAIGLTEPYRLVLRDDVRGLVSLVDRAKALIRRCERIVPNRTFRALDINQATAVLRAMPLDEAAHYFLEAGLRQTRCLLPVLLPLALAATVEGGGLGPATDVALPEAPVFDGLPAYAMDGFTRSGRRVLYQLRRVAFRTWLAPLPTSVQADALHHLLFFAEGGLATPLHSDSLSRALRGRAIRHGIRLPEEALAAFAQLLPLIHQLRRDELRKGHFL
jgi:hypothetical protein